MHIHKDYHYHNPRTCDPRHIHPSSSAALLSTSSTVMCVIKKVFQFTYFNSFQVAFNEFWTRFKVYQDLAPLQQCLKNRRIDPSTCYDALIGKCGKSFDPLSTARRCHTELIGHKKPSLQVSRDALVV